MTVEALIMNLGLGIMALYVLYAIYDLIAFPDDSKVTIALVVLILIFALALGARI